MKVYACIWSSSLAKKSQQVVLYIWMSMIHFKTGGVIKRKFRRLVNYWYDNVAGSSTSSMLSYNVIKIVILVIL